MGGVGVVRVVPDAISQRILNRRDSRNSFCSRCSLVCKWRLLQLENHVIDIDRYLRVFLPSCKKFAYDANKKSRKIKKLKNSRNEPIAAFGNVNPAGRRYQRRLWSCCLIHWSPGVYWALVEVGRSSNFSSFHRPSV